MKAAVVVIILSMACANARAQKVYKCTAANGTVTFAHEPCGADAKEIDTSKANKHSAPHDRSEIINSVTLDDLDHDCQLRVDHISRDANLQIGQIEVQISRLRNDMAYSKNNLAGAQRDTGIQTQITGLEARVSAMETTRDTSVLAAQENCRVKHDAEVARQDGDRQRRAAAAAVKD